MSGYNGRIDALHHSLGGWAHTTFASLSARNYRLFFTGQAVSLVGTWTQSVAQSWLVLTLTGSGSALGITVALQSLPMVLLAPYGGVLADRFSKRRLLFITQIAMALCALTLGILVATGAVRLWMVFILALAQGAANAVDNPTRQSFIHELVNVESLRNAVTLNSLEVNLSRVIGPAVAGVLIATVGIALCFLLNALSYVAVLWCLYRMEGSELHRRALVEPAKGQIREGLAYTLHTPLILKVLVMMMIVGTMTYEFQVTLPLLAKTTFSGDASSYALFTSMLGVGSVVGGLFIAGQGKVSIRWLTFATVGFGVAMLALSIAPSMAVAAGLLVVVGVFSIAFTSLTNTILQLNAAPAMLGRVMSLWSVAFIGSTLVGAPIVGWFGENISPHWSIAIGGIAALIAAVVGLFALRKKKRETK